MQGPFHHYNKHWKNVKIWKTWLSWKMIFAQEKLAPERPLLVPASTLLINLRMFYTLKTLTWYFWAWHPNYPFHACKHQSRGNQFHLQTNHMIFTSFPINYLVHIQFSSLCFQELCHGFRRMMIMRFYFILNPRWAKHHCLVDYI